MPYLSPSIRWLQTVLTIFHIQGFGMVALRCHVFREGVSSASLDNLLAPPSYLRRVQVSKCFGFYLRIAWDLRSTSVQFPAGWTEQAKSLIEFWVLPLGLMVELVYEHLNKSGETIWVMVLLVAQWCVMLPFYMATTPFNLLDENSDYSALDELAMSLYFHWLSAAAFFAVIDVVQSHRGAYFSLEAYTFLLVMMVALVVRVHDLNHDPAVAIFAAWVLQGLICSRTQFEGEMLETVEKLRGIAVAVMPVFALMVIEDLLCPLFG